MPLSSVMLSIGILFASFLGGILFYYVVDHNDKQHKKYELDQFLNVLIQFILYLWLMKIIAQFSMVFCFVILYIFVYYMLKINNIKYKKYYLVQFYLLFFYFLLFLCLIKFFPYFSLFFQYLRSLLALPFNSTLSRPHICPPLIF